MELLFYQKLPNLSLLQPNHSQIELKMHQLEKSRVQSNKNKLFWMNSKLQKTKRLKRQQKLMQLLLRKRLRGKRC